jgi:hypothetical protein
MSIKRYKPEQIVTLLRRSLLFLGSFSSLLKTSRAKSAAPQ